MVVISAGINHSSLLVEKVGSRGRPYNSNSKEH
jgi:hypothetical protein